MSTRISRRDFAKTAAYASLGTAVAGSSVYVQALAKEGSVDWAMNATIIDGCSCRMLCPCIFGSLATVGSAATHEHAGRRSCSGARAQQDRLLQSDRSCIVRGAASSAGRNPRVAGQLPSAKIVNFGDRRTPVPRLSSRAIRPDSGRSRVSHGSVDCGRSTQ